MWKSDNEPYVDVNTATYEINDRDLSTHFEWSSRDNTELTPAKGYSC